MLNMSEKFDILGVEMSWKLTAAETDNKYCVLEATIPPGVVVPPHRHPDQEAFFILEGAPEFATEHNGTLEWCFATPGETINLPSMTLHGFRNPLKSSGDSRAGSRTVGGRGSKAPFGPPATGWPPGLSAG